MIAPIDFNFNAKKAHFMLDLETLSTEKNAAILSIGVTEVFTANPASFYSSVDLNSQPETFFHRSNETLKWWLDQETEVREAAFKGDSGLGTMLGGLSFYLNEARRGRELVIWANHTDFDMPIIEHAFDYVYDPHPWRYNQKEDYATMLARFSKVTGLTKPKIQGKHNALIDAQVQAYCLEHMVSRLMQNYSLDLNL